VSGLPHPVKIYELWCTVPARGMKNTLSLSSTSRDKLSRENAHNARSPITLQENLLTVIMPNLCARDTGFPQLRGQDGISLNSKVRPLKFCLMSKVFHGISLMSKVFRENET